MGGGGRRSAARAVVDAAMSDLLDRERALLGTLSARQRTHLTEALRSLLHAVETTG